jgi:hypothetical protein
MGSGCVIVLSPLRSSVDDKYTYYLATIRHIKLAAMAKSFDFEHAPGHLVRRAHQLAVAVFMEEDRRL